MDARTALRLVKKYARQNPSRVVDNCQYVSGNYKPDCIIGHILVNDCGVKPAIFKLRNNYGGTFNGSWITNSYLLYAIKDTVTFSPRALAVLEKAQFVQDNNQTWQKAAEAAESVYYKQDCASQSV